MAYPSVTYTFTNGTTADGANVSTNFTNLVSGFSDGTKDFNMNAGTLAGNFTCNGNVVLGNATSDTIGITGAITISTAGSYLANVLGTVLLPTYTFSGDLNTGMWSSGADAIDFSTGGVQRLRIDSSGVVRIGSSATPPTASIRVGQSFGIDTAAASGGMSVTTWSATAAEASFVEFNRSKSATPGTQSIVTSGDALGFLNFRASDGVAFLNTARISAEVDGTPGVNDMPGRLMFLTTADGAASLTERMRIDSAGDVYIGKTSSSTYGKLSLYDTYQTVAAAVADVSGLYICSTDSMAINTGGTLSFGGSYTGTTETRFAGIAGLKENVTDNNYAGYLAFYTRPAGSAPVERMKISSTGGLIVNGGNVYDNDISFNDTSAGKSHALYTLSTGTPGMYFDHRATSNTGTFSWRVGTGGATTLMTLLASGNLHINTTTERSCKLVVSNSDTATNTQFGQSHNTGVCLINTSATNGNFTFICNKDSNGTLNSQICFVNADHTSQGYIDMVCRNGVSYYLTRINSVGQIYSVATYNCAVGATNRAMYVDNVGLIGNLTSTREAKANIQDLESVEWLKNLKPRQFNYRFKNDDGSYSDNLCKDLEYGLIAEEVEETNKLLVFYDEKNNNGKLQGVHYNKLIVPMLKMIQELSAEVAALKSKLP